ncbi:AAA family ATPase [Anaerosolibacter sp.]|uniref:AAA family ATPase n=1 Tax=Anaerosolibacter sp. TaxID=1872527 RepID=UPI0039F0728C
MNKIIAIWGNSNSGKTTFSIKLAIELSRQKKNVILIHSDYVTPVISTVLPLKDTKDQSLGNLLSSVQITQDEILKKCMTLDNNEYLSIMGYLHGENERTYAKYGKENIVDFFILLKHLADHIIIDCSSMVTQDILSRTALELSDQVIRLITPDLKAVSYFVSTLPMIAERKFNLQNHVKVLSNVKPDMPKDAVSNKFGGILKELDFSEEIERQFYEGRLFESLMHKKSAAYLKIVDDLVACILGENESTKSKTTKENPMKGLWKRGGKDHE